MNLYIAGLVAGLVASMVWAIVNLIVDAAFLPVIRRHTDQRMKGSWQNPP